LPMISHLRWSVSLTKTGLILGEHLKSGHR
jgi:hypothetical protein